MKLDVLGRVGLGAARARLGGHSAPLTTWLSVTNRCDASCSHCGMPFRAQKELTTPQVHKLVDALAQAGCQAVILTGGEPLVRRDIVEIVGHLVERGLWVRLETNGYRYPDLADQLPGIGHLAVSIDGDEATNDGLREPGAYQKAVAALDAASSRGIPTSTVTVLTSRNLGALDAVLTLCEQRGILAAFRTLHHNEELDGGPSHDLRPADADLRRALRYLIEARREMRHIATTEKTLRTLVAWKDYAVPWSAVPQEDQQCMAGRTHVFIDADGTVYPCRQRVGTTPGKSVRTVSSDEAFASVKGHGCQACAATDLCERNAVDSLNVPALLGVAKNWSRTLNKRVS
jgi:MoaA/NifB/PqqE/SkfB family radical SAM enzyme